MGVVMGSVIGADQEHLKGEGKRTRWPTVVKQVMIK